MSVREGERSILENVNLSFRSGELVALLGPSGSGKSTLLRAMNGFRRGQGTVEAFDQDLYQNFDRLKHRLGYVPQDDVLHRALTVRRLLEYSARLRLPMLTEGARSERIDAVLAEVDLTDRADVRVRRLSGGQRKRASVAIELLARPELLFLDEPTSGLDPGLEGGLMHMFRGLADDGCLVLVTTHIVSSLRFVDLAVFVAAGRIVFVGPPDHAPAFFGADSVEEVYSKIAAQGASLARLFERSALYRTYVLERLGSSPGPGQGDAVQKAIDAPREGTQVAPSTRAEGETRAEAADVSSPRIRGDESATDVHAEAQPPLSAEDELRRLKAELKARRT